MQKPTCLTILACLTLAACSTVRSAELHDLDPDRDGDGLSDFQEVHKYCTNPDSADSDGDGVADSDWHERREYSYSIRTVIQVLPAYDKATLEDDYQDCRVLFECDEYIELEVIHYPLNTVGTVIGAREQWRAQTTDLQRYVAAGVTTNYDAAMHADVRRPVGAAGIDVEALSDRQLVEQVSAWALKHSTSMGKTCVWAVDFDESGQPSVLPQLAASFAANKGDSTWSDREQFARELFGKGMYEHRTRGTCTTSAVYLATVLRALGMPTRCIVTIPVVDASDPRNMAMVEARLSHHRVRQQILNGLRPLQNSWAAHTYNEVWVDGRWRRLNYAELGQNILDANYCGLMTHVHTFDDLSTARLGAGWGVGRERPSDVFRHNNPYTCLTLSDQFGVHCAIDNPEVGESKLSIQKAIWFHSGERPNDIAADWHGAIDRRNGDLLLVVAGSVDLADLGGFGVLYQAADPNFVLRAPGCPDVALVTTGNWWRSGQILHARIEATELVRMQRGVSYTLSARNESKGSRWHVDNVRVQRDS